MLCFIGILKCFLVRFIFNARQEKENSIKCSVYTGSDIFERGEFLPVQPLTLLHGTVQILFQIAELFAV